MDNKTDFGPFVYSHSSTKPNNFAIFTSCSLTTCYLVRHFQSTSTRHLDGSA